MTTPDRFDIHHEQYLQDWIEDNLRHQYEVCADWIPWNDAKPSSNEKEAGPWAPQEEDQAATGWQESASSSAGSSG